MRRRNVGGGRAAALQVRGEAPAAAFRGRLPLLPTPPLLPGPTFHSPLTLPSPPPVRCACRTGDAARYRLAISLASAGRGHRGARRAAARDGRLLYATLYATCAPVCGSRPPRRRLERLRVSWRPRGSRRAEARGGPDILSRCSIPRH